MLGSQGVEVGGGALDIVRACYAATMCTVQALVEPLVTLQPRSAPVAQLDRAADF